MPAEAGDVGRARSQWAATERLCLRKWYSGKIRFWYKAENDCNWNENGDTHIKKCAKVLKKHLIVEYYRL